MYKSARYFLFLFLVLLLGCTNAPEYLDKDIAAIVRGEEITVGELRFIYSDNDVINMIEGTVKAKLVIQESKSMNLDVSEEVKKTLKSHPMVDHEFIESQAKKLKMQPEKYYKKYIGMTVEMTEYMRAYIEKMLGQPKDNMEKYNEEANQLLNNLMEKYEDEVTIRIKNN